jgi:proline iminopeptidase
MRDLSQLRSELYPPIDARASGMLDLDDLHTMYWEESGSPTGIPVLFLHGGPGGGASPRARQFFDPWHYRIVVFDQRGAGRSTPLGETRRNTTQLLVADIERLRRKLGVDRWLVFGGSWGSTLALAYGIAHPEHCLGFVLRGIFLGAPYEIDWFISGIRHVFPEAWRALLSHVPASEQQDVVQWFHDRLADPDPEVHMPLARAWSSFEASCSTLLADASLMAHSEEDVVAIGIARMETHYFVNDLFLAPDALLEGVDRLRHLPCSIVQGRYDMVCPIVTADALARAWPEAHYVIVPDAGHSAWEPGTTAALVRACERMKAAIRL